MAGPETPPSPEVPLTRAEKEKLLKKMYSLPHWIALVRLFGYQTLSMETAREQIKPIAEKFGKEKTAEACEVLVEIVPGKEPLARLKSHIRRMAFQILGPETVQPEPVAPPTSGRREKTRRAKAVPGPDAKPVKQPRHYVLKKCEEWLQGAGHAFVAVDDVKKTTPAVAPYVGSLDFIVLRGEEKLLVTVRPHLQEKHRAAIAELQKLFGSEYRPVRMWPTDGPDGWTWQEYAIDA